MLVDVQAEGRVSSRAMGRSRSYKILLSASGPVEDMSFDFSSSPPNLSDQTIVALLAGPPQFQQALEEGGSSELGQAFSSALIATVFRPVEEAFQNALGLDEFELEMGYDEPLRVKIGDRIFNKFYVDYTRVIGTPQITYTDVLEEIKLSYRLRRALELQISTDQDREMSLGVEGRVRF